MKAHYILVIGERGGIANGIVSVLSQESYYTLTTTCIEEALEKLRENQFDLIIAHQTLGRTSLEELLEKVGKSRAPRIRIILTDHSDIHEQYSTVGTDGIYWIVTTPWRRETLSITVRNALHYANLLSRNEALLETANVLAAKDLPFEEKLQQILMISLKQIDAEKGSIMLRDEQGDLVVKAATNQKLIGVKRFLEDEKSVSIWVVKHGKSLFVKNIKEDSRFKPAEEALYKNDNFLCIPVKNEKDEVIGVFNVTDKRGGALFSKEDETSLSAFIGRIVLLIENAQLKEELEKERTRLRKKNEELLALEKVREDLVNMIIHDLKGPLGEVMANLDLLGYGNLESQEREYLDTAIQGSNNLLRMIFNLLDVRKMEEGKLRLHSEKYDVGELIDEVITKHKTILRQKEIEVKRVVDEKVSTWIADRLLIERVLSNLLINAVEYSHRGGMVEVVCSYHQMTEQLRMEIKDSGKGIPEEFHQKIFNKFSQVDSGYANRRHSTGLGLAFCKMAVEAHQGRIWVESEEGKGSTFIFLLPPMGVDNLV